MVVVGGGGEQGPTSPPHRLFDCDGCTNCGLMKEKSANSAWSMLAMTSSSGGVSWGWVRVKNLSKFSAALPHWKKRDTGEGLDGGQEPGTRNQEQRGHSGGLCTEQAPNDKTSELR